MRLPKHITLTRVTPDNYADVADAVKLIRELHAKSPLSKYTLKENAVTAYITDADVHKTAACWLLHDNKKKPRRAFGIYGAYLNIDPFYDYNTVWDFACYIQPPYRGFKYSHIFIAACEQWAKSLPYYVHALYQGVVTGNPEAVAAFKRAGFFRTPQVVLRKKLFDL